jgi:hypothetical protein
VFTVVGTAVGNRWIGSWWPGGPSGVREWAGLARSATATRVDLSEMHHPRPRPFPRGVTTGPPVGEPALRALQFRGGRPGG